MLGGRGRIGHAVAERFEAEAIASAQCDITDAAAVRRLLGARRPRVVFNCAALTDLARCEREPEQAWRVNVDGVANLAAACRESGSVLVHFSSNFAADPVNVYARTKAASESRGADLVVRGAFYAAWHWILRDLARGRRVRVLAATFFNPLTVAAALDVVDALLARGQRGLVNVGVESRVSYLDFALAACRLFGFAPELVSEVDDVGLTYGYPRDTVLDTSRLRALGLAVPSLDEDMRRLRIERLVSAR